MTLYGPPAGAVLRLVWVNCGADGDGGGGGGGVDGAPRPAASADLTALNCQTVVTAAGAARYVAEELGASGEIINGDESE